MIQPGGGQTAVNLDLSSGEMQGLINLRNNLLPNVSDQLSEYVSGAVSAINAAHNTASAVPPPQTLTGAATGLDLPTAVSGFTRHDQRVAIVDSSGNLQEQVAIDFTNQTMSVNGGAATSYTSPANFLTALNSALGTYGTASFTNGALSIQATASTNGVAIADGTPPSSRNGEGFSQYFGLNNLISASTVTNYQTGLKATDPSGFPAGQTLTLRVSDASGSEITDG